MTVCERQALGVASLLRAREGGMTENSAGTHQRGLRRAYVKRFVRNLDASDTQGKEDMSVVETTPNFVGPS